jgi:DNA-binding transcriptional ArsR family regulator
LTARCRLLTLNLMVNYREEALDRIFAALADPTRRALVAQLEGKESLTVSELAKPFPVSLPAIMKHLDMLSDAGLITRSKSGRTVNCQLTAAAMKSAMDWLHRYERFWNAGLDRLGAILEEDESWPPKQPQPPSQTLKSQILKSQASPSSAASRRRPPRSTPRGPTRRS